jgi:multidrug efflux system membrane fusion protein
MADRSPLEIPPRPSNLKELPAPPQPKALLPERRRHRTWIWLVLVALLAFAGFRYFQSKQQQRATAAAQTARQANRAVSVAASPVRRGNMPIYLRGLGTVTAFNTVNVKPRVDGPIVTVHYMEGQFVNKGDPLVQIDPRPFQVALQQAEGQKARDQAQLKDAQVNLARYQALWDGGVIARQQLDTQAAQVGQFEGTIEADQAAIDNAKLQLSFTNVTAPLSGRIGLRQVDIGNIVHAADPNPLAIITQVQPISVLFTIPADSLPPVMAKLRAGTKLPVDAYDRADRNKIATGTLETVDNQIDTTTGTSRLKATFENADSSLFPNQFVNCRLLLETRSGVAIVPLPAVQRGAQGSYVFVVKPDQTVTMRNITTGVTEGNNVEVTSGVAPGEMVVTDGQDKLQEGGKVQIRPENGAGGTARP